MQIIQQYPVKVFKNTYQDKVFYKVGLSKKDQNGNYINGAIDCKFKKGENIDDSKKIYIQEAWLDFYVKDKITHPFIFINKYEYVSDVVKESKNEIDPFAEFGNEVVLTDDDLPF